MKCVSIRTSIEAPLFFSYQKVHLAVELNTEHKSVMVIMMLRIGDTIYDTTIGLKQQEL